MLVIDRAHNFLEDQGPLSGDQYCETMVETVSYMLDHAVGFNNAISTDTIIEFLKTRGHDIKREQWQTSVLGPLRKSGIYIGSARSKGMFLIADQSDAKVTIEFIEDQIQKQTTRLEILRELVKDAGWEV